MADPQGKASISVGSNEATSNLTPVAPIAEKTLGNYTESLVAKGRRERFCPELGLTEAMEIA